MEEASLIKPLFNYSYKGEGVILDQKYNYQGNILAVCNSHGHIILYSSNSEEPEREMVYLQDRKHDNDDQQAVLKIAWSMPIFGLFAAATVTRHVELYTCSKQTITPACSTQLSHIPQALAFCPIESEVLLAVGLSNGVIVLLN